MQALSTRSETARSEQAPRFSISRKRLGWAMVLSEYAQRTLWWSVGLIIPTLIIALWHYAVAQQWVAEQLLPSPLLVVQTLVELWHSGDLWFHLSISLKRIFWSCLIGGGLGLLLGVALGLSRQVKTYLYPTFEVVSQFPVIGWIPLLIIFVGIDEPLNVSAIAIAVVVPVTINTYKGIGLLPRTLLEVARVYRFSLSQVLLRIVLPGTLPSLFNGFRQGIMQAWLALVFVELLAASEGIGYMMVWGRQLMQPDLIVVSMITIGAVGLLLDSSLRLLEKYTLRTAQSAFKS